jgi:segregation and condensation protein A
MSSDDTGTQSVHPPEAEWDGPECVVPASDSLIVDVDGFEGPLDLLLSLARDQKVDLARISILALAEQYLSYIHAARKVRLELAADYLVMAAWLAYLKSRLLLPEPGADDEPSGQELAALLAFRLRRLDAMRQAAAQLMARNRLGRDVFERGDPDAIHVSVHREYVDNLHDLLKAYAERRQRGVKRPYVLQRPPVWTISDGRRAVERLIGSMSSAWTSLDDFLLDFLAEPGMRATIKASSFTATLELIREGAVEFRQDGVFAPIYLRRPASAAA